MNDRPPNSEAQTDVPAGEKPRTKVPRWLRLLVSLTLLGVLLQGLDFAVLAEVLLQVRGTPLAVMVLLMAALRIFAAYRWHVLLRALGSAVRFGDLLRISLVSNFLGFLFPGGLGVDLMRVYRLSRTSVSLAISFTSVLVERILAFLALILLVLIGLALTPSRLAGDLEIWALLGLACVSLASVVLLHPGIRAIMDRLLLPAWLAQLRRALAKLYACLDDYGKRPALLLWGLLQAVLFQLLRVAVAAAGAWALQIEVPYAYFVVLVPIITFFSLLPISIAGLGIREVGFVTLFGLAGVDPEAALALSLLVSALATLTAILPGACLIAAGKRRA